MICLQENFKNWGIDIFQLVDMAILIGTGYIKGVKVVGPNILSFM